MARFDATKPDESYISIGEARQVMGPESDGMTDEEVQRAIYDFTAIIRQYIKAVPKC